MNKLTAIASTLALLSASSISFAQEPGSSQDNGGDSNGIQRAPMQLPIDIGYTYFPSSTQSDFRAVGASAGGGADLTCSGVTMDGAFQSMVGDFESLTGSLVGNAPGFLVNYLIYSSPSLYSLIQNMKEGVDFNLGAANATCNAIRSQAKKNWDENAQVTKQDECMNREGGASSNCISGDLGPIDFIVNKKLEWSETIQEYQDQLNDLFSTECEGLDPDNPTVMQIVFSRSPNQCPDLDVAQRLLGDQGINDETGEPEPIPPEADPSEVVADLATESRDLIEALLGIADNGISKEEATRRLSERSNVSMSLAQQRMLQQLNREDPARYDEYVKRFSSMMAINSLETMALKLEVGLLNGAANVGTVNLAEGNVEFVERQIKWMKSFAALERKKLENQQAEAEMLSQGFKLLEQSRLNR